MMRGVLVVVVVGEPSIPLSSFVSPAFIAKTSPDITITTRCPTLQQSLQRLLDICP
jgi:hypothetical protein